MALQFVLGSSGSGKTKYMFEQIVREAGKHPAKNYLVIVPEQFTLATQQTLVDLAPNHAIMNIDVLSFKRLAYRVFDDMGIRNLNVLEETGKNLILRKVAQERETDLTVLRPNMSRMGYIEELKSFISELAQYNIGWQQLENFAEGENLPPAFAQKLKDVVTMYRGFEAYMEGTYITAEEILNLLISVADKSSLLRDSVLVFDEFTGFTPVQNRLFYKLLPIADRIHVLLTIDAAEDFYHCEGEHELFYLSKKTIRTLTDMAAELKIECLDPVVLADAGKKRFINAPGIGFLEQNLFRTWYKKCHDGVTDIHITSLKDAQSELIYVARNINRLVQSGAYRYKDIAVVTGAVDTYGNYVEAIFSKYGIPYFLDQTTGVLFHPFIEFIRATLEIIESGFDYNSVMRFLRCGFCRMEDEEIDCLDNYLLATGIRGQRAWGTRWLRQPKNSQFYDMEHLEEIRIAVYDLLAPLANAFSKENGTAKGEIEALYGLICSLDLEAQLRDREQEYLEIGEQAKAKEYGQIYRIVMELLDKFYLLLGEEHLSIAEFTEILEAGLSASQVAAIPPGYDNVTIGDIERTRLNYIKILFFVGVNDGVIPKNANTGGIISEYERQMMQSYHMELAPGAREKAFIQRFYLYRNLTKPSDAIYISYAKIDSEGKKVSPSYLINVIRKLFPRLGQEEIPDIYQIADYSTSQAAWDYLIHGEHDEAWKALAKYFLENDNSVISTEELLRAPYRSYEAEPISRAVAKAIYGPSLQGSVTRLEQFAACAYAHFLRYGLHLQPREESGMESVDVGNLYHAALEKYSRHLEESDYDWFKVPEEQRDELASAAFQEALDEYTNLAIYDTAENRHMTERMADIFRQTVWALTSQVRAGEFVPTEFELSFDRMDNLDSLRVALEDHRYMQLQGRIDRLDLAQENGKTLVKIIDYKSGSTKFDLIRIYRGLSLQLVVYMNAAMEYTRNMHPSGSILPGGILYYHIDDPVLDEKDADSDQKEALLLALRPDGLVNSEEEIYRSMDRDFEKKSLVIPVEIKKNGELAERGSHVASTEEFEVIENYVKKEIVNEGNRIYDGEIAVNPYKDGQENSCMYCPYRAVCGLDERIPGYGYRKLEALTREEALERMRQG
ncbi:MAG: exodeoxyribonuclease V subunit gamma [Agathobacter sp.]|nr:exodeoxyribonuclease V subunit gamma [Agathobacter sp.]